MRREIVFLAIPPGFLFVLSSSSELGIGYRHLFPMFPLLYVLVAGCAAYLVSKNPKYAYGFAALLLWQVITTVTARPGLLAYANEAWGGPSKTHLVSVRLQRGLGPAAESRADIILRHTRLSLATLRTSAQGPVDFRDYGISCRVLPTGSAFWTGLDTMRFGDDPNVSGTRFDK